MIRILALILLLLPNLAFAQNPSPTQQQVLNAIASNLPTNNANQISALLLRNTLDLMTSAIFSPSGTVTFNGPIAALNTVVPASYTTPAYSFNDIGITGLNFPDTALHFAFTITGNSPPTGSGGYVGLNVSQFGVGRGPSAFVVGAIENAIAIGGSGHYFGSNPYVVVCGTIVSGLCPLGTPAALSSASGMEVDFFGFTGGTTVYKEGVRITDQSQIQASGVGALSTAITVARIPSAPGYQYAMYLGDPTLGDGFFPLTSTGSVIKLNTSAAVIDSIIDGSGIAGPITNGAFRLPDNIFAIKWPSWSLIETPSLIAFQTSGGSNGLLIQTAASFFSGTVASGVAGVTAGAFILEGLTTGAVTIQTGNANAGTFNFNLPVTAGTSNQCLQSQGGGTSAMTWFGCAPLASPTFTGTVTTPNLTVTTTFTATGLVTNADLVNPSTTVNTVTCTLGSSCTVTAAAGTLTGTTLNSTVVTSSLTSVGTLTSLASSGNITSTNHTFTAAAPTVAAAQIGIGSTTVAAGASNCPTGTVGGATVSGCWVINVAGTQKVVPYF